MATRHILVRLPNWLGDVLMSRPLLHGLRRLPGEIRAVGPGPLIELLEAERLFDGVDPWPPQRRERRTLIRNLRAWSPDAALVLPPSFSSAWFAWRIGARLRVGYRSEGRGILLHGGRKRPPRGDLHLSREYLALGASLQVAEPRLPTLRLPPEARARASSALGRDPDDAPRFVILGPGATYGPAKRWAPERFAELGRRMAGRGYDVLVCGAGGERALCQAVASAIGGARSLAGRTDLLGQAGLCAAARLVMCNDSGLGHLSAAVGSPTVVVFGSTSSAWTAPLGPRVAIVQRAPVCSPCFRRTCRIGYRCLERIESADVERVCLEMAA